MVRGREGSCPGRRRKRGPARRIGALASV